MHKQTQAEIAVLYRVMHLLEENSVAAAAEHDASFQRFLARIYGQIDMRASRLMPRNI